MPDFFDWIRGKLYKKPRRARLTLPANASKRQIRAMVQRLCNRDDANYAFQALLEFGSGAAESVEWALDRPEFQSLEWLPHTRSPFENCLHLLTLWRRPRALTAALAALDQANQNLQRIGIEFCLAAGRTEAAARAEAIIQGPATKSNYEHRSFTVSALERGVSMAMRLGYADSRYVKTVYPLLLGVVQNGMECTLGTITKLMLKFNHDQALADLRSDAVLSLNNKSGAWVLEALCSQDVPIEGDQLLRLLSQTSQRMTKYPAEYVIQSALKLLAKARHPETDKWIEICMASPNQDIAEAALDALCILKEMNPDKFVFRQLKQLGFDAMTAPQQQFIAVTILDGEVRNGGFLQYFSNSSGSQANVALSGLREAGVVAHAELLKEAIAAFGPAGVPVDRDERNSKLAKLMERENDPFSRLDSRWYDIHVPVRRKLLEFALAHPLDFGGQRGAEP